jgi:hypothetical protein
MTKETTHKNVHVALAAVQAEIENPERNKTAKMGSYEFKYPDLATTLETALPVLSKHGIALVQTTKVSDGQVILETALVHGDSGTEIRSEYPVCSVNNDHAKMGAALTYSRRHHGCAVIGIAPADDMDAEGAAKSGDGDRVKMSAAEAKREINWEQIEKTIRTAKSQDALDRVRDRVQANKGVWPHTFIAKSFEEIESRRNELEVQEKASGYDSPYDAFQDCLNVDQIVHMTDALIQLGGDETEVQDAADFRREELQEQLL